MKSYRAKDNKRLHRIWKHMVERCCNPKSSSYCRYGANGITICDEWRNDFKAFCKWAWEHGYDPELEWRDCTIDRIDNSRGYCPDNCRWVSMSRQAYNRSNNRTIEYQGETLTVTEWSQVTGLKLSTLLKRLNSGWSIEKALTQPVMLSKSHGRRSA